ncbi:hypothetical protein [Pyxidicoccus sp. MSG2]|uniref:hypothetical protein n=1 Tax=Pyxidicoccus sp. MSG2 TaxID=2996790 RepID=UPI00226D8130|nr:hypothetical protein [Pyxidicoccus sp. MSG2]MCY1023979.1 hypothetical protein [Pyxidicoccus sp. MSG2]
MTTLSEQMRTYLSRPTWAGGPTWEEEDARWRLPGAQVEWYLEGLEPPRVGYAGGNQSPERSVDLVLGLYEDGWRVTALETQRDCHLETQRRPDVVWGSGLSEVAARQVVTLALCELGLPADAQEVSRRECVAVCGEDAPLEAGQLLSALTEALTTVAPGMGTAGVAVATQRRRATALVHALVDDLGKLSEAQRERGSYDERGDVWRAAHVLAACAPWPGLRDAAHHLEAAARARGWHHLHGWRQLYWEMDWGDEPDLELHWDADLQRDIPDAASMEAQA